MSPTQPGSTPWLRGIRFSDGTRDDVESLHRHHYRPGLPATFSCVRVARKRVAPGKKMQTLAVAALSWPVPMVRARNRHFNVIGYGNALRFANANVRTLSRVIVHPQYRAVGLAARLVRQLVARCPTRYVECSTTMGRYATFLLRCGFVELPTEPGEPAYFLLDREAKHSAAPREQLHPSSNPRRSS